MGHVSVWDMFLLFVHFLFKHVLWSKLKLTRDFDLNFEYAILNFATEINILLILFLSY